MYVDGLDPFTEVAGEVDISSGVPSRLFLPDTPDYTKDSFITRRSLY